MSVFVQQAFASDTLAADLDAAAVTGTLTTGNFGTPTGEQMLIVDYDNSSREIIKCAINGTGLTSIDRAQDDTSDVDHVAGAKVIMTAVPSHYKALTDFVGARVYLASTLGTTVSSAWTKVALDTESYDVGGNFASNKFVAPVNGYYQISACIYYSNVVAAAKRFQAAVYKNGAQIFASAAHSGLTAEISCILSDTVYLAATDYIEFYYFHSDATTVDVVGGANFTFLTVALVKEV